MFVRVKIKIQIERVEKNLLYELQKSDFCLILLRVIILYNRTQKYSERID